MNNYVTKQDVQNIVQDIVGKAVEELTSIVVDFMRHVDERFNKVEAGISEMRTDIGKLKEDNRRFLARADEKDDDDAVRDSRIERLEHGQSRFRKAASAKT